MSDEEAKNEANRQPLPNTINFRGNIYQGEDPLDDEQRLRIYREWVRHSTSNLLLHGVDVLSPSDPNGEQKPMRLTNLYVHLETTSILRKDLAQKQLGRSVVEIEEPFTPRPLTVLECVFANPTMVLLSDPGSGKSTFLNFLAHCLVSHALQPDQNWVAHLPGWSPRQTYFLPIFVNLGDFARHFAEKLPARAEPEHLFSFIKTRLVAQNLAFVVPIIEKILYEYDKRAIVLLDGLHEAPTEAQRIFVRDVISVFAKRYRSNRYLVTSSVQSYQPNQLFKPNLRLEMNDFPPFEIAAFDQPKIDRFVNAWSAELGRLGSVPVSDVPSLAVRLREALRRPDLEPLSHTPLLLTAMSLIYTHRRSLPNVRAQFHEEIIDILLSRWQQPPNLLEVGGIDVDLKPVLCQLAYEAHATSKHDETGETLAYIPEQRILKALAALPYPYCDLHWASRLVDLMKVSPGMLLERQPAIFTFPHRSFQEYLAGAHLAAQANFAELGSKLAAKDMPLWRESILYAVRRLVNIHRVVAKPLMLVEKLCPNEAQDDEISWQCTQLAGDILHEIGLRQVRESVFGCDLLERIQLRLKDLLETDRLPSLGRVRAGNILATLGDPRFDPQFFSLPVSSPTLGFIRIPAGPFIMGDDDKYNANYLNERPKHELNLPYDYWLAKYPVTVAQYRIFIKTSGYKTSDANSLNGIATHPVVRVNWYDAIAYCAWLNVKLKEWAQELLDRGLTNPELAEDGTEASDLWTMVNGLIAGQLSICLPSEVEWEKAARSSDGRIYPWGADKENPNTANLRFEIIRGPLNINSIAPVGAFPAGISPYGLLDMIGNTAEWTRSLWGES